MKKVELLAPCGSLESLYAAVQNGADAVYLGGSRFSARAYASNFNDENMIIAADYCHLYGVKIYVTFNTLIKDSEMTEALEYVKFLYEAGIDALIIQDTGLAYLIRKNFQDFELHASTQMTIHNAEAAVYYRNSGFKRIVLSRELTLKEIEYISKDLNIETEMFVHGALCVCYSGQCLMSSLIGGRSGNRGRCAQPCRLPYTIINENSSEEYRGYLLSPKDMCTLENIKDIIESGTSSLKIEGRMKRPEYVAGVVQIYRNAIDSIYSGDSFDFKNSVKKLMQLFNREGFSRAYLYGNTGRDMMAYNFPKNTGLYLGKVNKDLSVTLEENIGIKDGVRVGDSGFTVSKIIKNSKEVDMAYSKDQVKLLPCNYKSGDVLYKTSDTELLKNLQVTFAEPFIKVHKLQLSCKVKIDEPFEVSCTYDGKTFTAAGDKVQKALKKSVDSKKIEENLKKTGNTAFEISDIGFSSFQDGFLPVSVINSVRRELIEKIEIYIYGKSKRKAPESIDFNREEKTNSQMEQLLVSIENTIQLEGCIKSGVKAIIADIFSRKSDIKINKIDNMDVYIKIPNIIKEEFTEICTIIDNNMGNIKGIVTGNAAIINKYSDKLDIIGDYKLNIFNKYSLDFYSRHLKAAAVSVELNKKEIGEISKNPPIPCIQLVYGKIELMVSEYCPIGSALGGKCSNSACSGECTKGNFTLKDRKGEKFTVTTDKFCRSHIYNSAILNLIPNLKEIKGLKHRIDFVDEDKNEVIEVLKSYSTGKWTGESDKFTKGHYRRGVD